MRTLALFALVGVIAMGPAPLVWAKGDPDLDALIWKAQQLGKTGDHAGALAVYREAFAKAPRAALLLDIALTQQKIGLEVESIDTFESYLKHPSADKTQKRRVQLLLADLYSRLGSLRIEVDKPASITVDGKLIGEGMLVATTRAMAGDHGVLAQAPGFQDATAKVTVEPGEEQMVELRMTKVPEANAQAKPGPEREPPPVVSVESPRPADDVAIESSMAPAGPAVLSLQARAEADVWAGALGPSLGLAIALGRRLEIGALALVQDTTGLRAAGTLYFQPDQSLRPFARAGVSAFFKDGTRAGAHLAGGLAWAFDRRLSVVADFSIEYFPDTPGRIHNTIPLLSVGVQAGVL